MFLRNSLFLLMLLIGLGANAETLKSLAQKSTVLLAASDEVAIQKKCSLTMDKISMLSQKLKSQVDEKIGKLTEADFKILDQRAESCQTDCSCNIYSLAYENRDKKNQVIIEKASKETAGDRLMCIQKIKNICSLIQKI